MRTTIKADFLSSKSFLPKTIVNKGITRDFRSLFVTYAKLTSSVTIGGIFTVSDQIDTLSNDALKVSAGKNYLSFMTESPMHLQVYTLNGKLMYSGMVRESKTVSLPSGLYIVKAKDYSKVVAVE